MNNVVPFPPQPPMPSNGVSVTLLRGDEVEIAEQAIALLQTSPLTFDEGKFWRYEPALGIWLVVADEQVRATVASFSGVPVLAGNTARPLKMSYRTISGAVNIARDKLAVQQGRAEFKNAPNGLAFKNGFLEVAGGSFVLHPHSPSHLARFAYPFDFVSNAPHGRLLGFLDTIFGDCHVRERQDRVALFQEFVGTSLAGAATKHQVALVLFGEGGEGKSETLKIARSPFPPGTIVSVPPQKWGERFQVERLAGARGNFVDEIPDRDITDGEIFKSVITGEPVHAERKHERAFNFNPMAGHIFSANTLPGTVDQSDGYWRRFLVLPFTRKMTELPTHRHDAAADVIANELPGIVAWFLQGAARVQSQGRLTIPAGAAQLLERWRRDADPVARFVTEECVADVQFTATSKELFEFYCKWAAFNNHGTMSATKFYKRFATAAKMARPPIPNMHTRSGNVYGCRFPRRFDYK